VDDLIQDLVLYRRFRRDRSVIMAARSLLNLIREINPAILQNKERGKFYDADAKPLEYGVSRAAEGVDGAELLQILEEEASKLAEQQEDDMDDEDIDEEDEEMEEGDLDEEDGMDEEDDNEEEDEEKDSSPSGGNLLEKSKKRKIEQVDRIDAKRILSSEDFARIRKLKQKLEEEKRNPRSRRKNTKQPRTSEDRMKNNLLVQMMIKKGMHVEGVDEEEVSDDPFASDMSSDDAGDDEEHNNDGAVDPRSLEGSVRRKRKELAERLEAVYEGRKASKQAGTDKRTGGMNDTEKSKKKNFLMVSKSRKVKIKQSTSLRQQQNSLRKHIKTLERSKKTMQKIRRKTK